MKVKELKEVLEYALFQIEDALDDDEIDMVSNTYFLRPAKYFMGVSGYDGGYFNLKDIKLLEHDKEDN